MIVLFVSHYSLTHLFLSVEVIIIVVIIIVIVIIETTMMTITSCYLGMTSWITVGGVGGQSVCTGPTRLRRRRYD